MTTPMHRKPRARDLHGLDANGSVVCNPRDKEAAHRAHVEGIATDDLTAITCTKCLRLMHRQRHDARTRPGK